MDRISGEMAEGLIMCKDHMYLVANSMGLKAFLPSDTLFQRIMACAEEGAGWRVCKNNAAMASWFHGGDSVAGPRPAEPQKPGPSQPDENADENPVIRFPELKYDPVESFVLTEVKKEKIAESYQQCRHSDGI